jgi:methionyl-tRNA formyltransferase
MRIIFMGTPEFAVPSLDILVKNGYQVVGVVTSPDSYGGRGGKQLIQSAVKKYAQQHDLKILQPEKLRSPDFLDQLKILNADVQIVVAFRMLPEMVWNTPPLGTFNLHGSLLPKYRGAAPINWAIINGEKETGVTSFKLSHEIDTGDIVMQKKIPIEYDDNAGSLHDKMMHTGAEVILSTIRLLEKENISFVKQSEEQATKAPKIFHDTCQIDFSKSSDRIYNFIRGLSPHPGAWTMLDGHECKILKAEIIEKSHSKAPGTIETDQKKSLRISTQDGFISVLELKMEGKRLMDIGTFLNGYSVKGQAVS